MATPKKNKLPSNRPGGFHYFQLLWKKTQTISVNRANDPAEEINKVQPNKLLRCWDVNGNHRERI